MLLSDQLLALIHSFFHRINPDAQCGPQTPGNKTCPLNVCCSAFGFCGMTDDYCKPVNGQPCWSNCKQPKLESCSGTSSIKRKLGYYAGWAARRSCDAFRPENLDLDGYTGVIFAFAEISEDFEITLDSKDDPLLKSLVKQKNDRWSDVKVSIAVGGWTFSMADPTRTIFSRMLATSKNRDTFISSVEKFISKYGLDGVDIDLEYPAAPERAAPPQDTPNLTKLFSEMRSRLGKGTIISLATPAGYWFLRGFELDKIEKHLDYFNVMSYDYHGPWDRNIKGEDGTAKPQTDTRDITTSMNLYKRIGLKFEKLNLGLSWYGRTYAVGDCKGKGCKMTGGGKPGPCTKQSGVKSQVEIWREIKDNNIKPTLDSSSSTYWYNHDGDFITFDDTETWNKKIKMAGETCFGGTFVWSLDQTKPSTPPPPVEDYDVYCQHIASEKVLEQCKTMVNDIIDTNEYDLNGKDKCFAAGARRAFPCYKDCCLYLAVENFEDVTIRAKEVKDAALQILEQCHGVENKRGVQSKKGPHMQVIPLIAAAWASAWLKVAVINAAFRRPSCRSFHDAR
ncbi:glycoside hydrolase superfamily [Coprinopsis sp. MPI-PUGE-AT-0042]|nr:glycoside hydrolase superfamily [Coprinopsis sp. MPI-PUGE-AT-0042]